MTADRQYQSVSYRPCELEHRYGPSVHILRDPLALSLLAKLCHRDVVQPRSVDSSSSCTGCWCTKWSRRSFLVSSQYSDAHDSVRARRCLRR